MHPSLSFQILNAFNCKVVCFFTISVVFAGITLADKLPSPSSSSLPLFRARNEWSLKHSNPTRDGKFLNVPIYYGDWVPIDTAKARLESLVSSVESSPNDNRRKDDNVVISSPTVATDDLTSPVKSAFVVSEQRPHSINQHHHHHQLPQVNDAEDRVEINHLPPYFIGPRLPSQQNHHKETNVRHNSVSRPFNRLRSYYRGGGGVGGNSRRKYRPTNSDALTRLFGPNLGSVINGKRRHHRKITQPHHSQGKPSSSVPLVDQISSIFGAAPTQDTAGLQTTTSTGSSAFQALGNVFNLLSPSLPNLKGSSRPDSHYVDHQPSEDIFQPVIKLLPSPDLTQDDALIHHLDDTRSSIYEDDGKGTGEIVVGRRPGQNEIDGFVHPVSSGETIKSVEHHNTEGFLPSSRYPGSQYRKPPSNFSVLISGISKNIDMQALAKLFKEGKVAEKGGNYKAFIGSSDASASDGFHKVILPFLDPSDTVSDFSKLPSIFIAPLGYKAPEGYKGHPLPFDPAPTDPFYSRPNKGKINLVHTTEPSSLSDVDDVVQHENEVKTTRFRNPFLRNKLRNQRLPYRPINTISTTETSVSLVSTGKEEYTTEGEKSGIPNPSSFVRSKIKLARNRFKTQRKRVLTKIVRKPYNPSATTPSPWSETKTIVRIIDPTDVSFKVEEYFPPTSGRPILGRNDKIDLVVDRDYNTTIAAPSLGISTTFRPIQIKYLDIQSTKDATTTNVPKLKENISATTEKINKFDSYEEENVGVTHFEPTTTHNNLVFETTQPEDQTTKNVVENDNNELYDDHDVTTVPPTSFVTRKSFTPKVTNRPITKLIQFVPYSPEATTRTTTSPITTATTKIVTDSSYNSYEPTPFSFNLDPIARLERLNNLKNKKYATSRPSSILDKEEENEYTVPTIRSTAKFSDNISYKVHNNRIKYRKYGYNQGTDDGRVFGQRIKERKRPTLWDNAYRDDYYATTTEEIGTTPTKKTKSDEYKRKFRPFFDQLYKQLTNDNDSDTEKPEGNNRRISVFSVRRKIRPYNGWRKKSRSTTTPNPFTINAEIYEVHPESRARITTTTTASPPPTFEVFTESSTQYEDYPNEFKENDYNLETQPNHLSRVDATQSPEKTEVITDIQADYNGEYVHETADKHTPVYHDHVVDEKSYDKQNPEPSSILIQLQGQTKLRPSWLNKNELSHNGLVESNIPLEFGESLFVENSLNEIVTATPEGSPTPVTRLLDQYQKTFKPSTQIANKHDSGYNQPKGIINEHSQQQLTVKEGDFIPFHNIREGDNWEPRPLVPYVEIQRSTSKDKSPVSISVETVPTDDTSLIQEVLEEVYNINGPSDPGLAQPNTLDSLNEIYHKPLPDYSDDSSGNGEYGDGLTNTEVTVTAKDDPIITTTLSTAQETVNDEVGTLEPHLQPESSEGTETTVSFFITPTTRRTVSYNDEILSDPQPTIQEDNLIIENGDLEESTTTLVTTAKDEPTSEVTENITELTEEATPEVGEIFDGHHNNESEEDITATSTTLSSHTSTTDNFEVTTFRPKGNGGFFDNFNLANLLSYIIPKRTKTASPITTHNPTTLQQESEPTTDIFSTKVKHEQSETTTETSVKSTSVQLISDFVSTDSPLATSLGETEEVYNTILTNEYDAVITTTPSTSSFIDTTKTSIPTKVSTQDETTFQNILNGTRATFETTAQQDDTDTTTDLIFTIITSKPQGVTEYDDEYEQDTTTAPNYITGGQPSWVRTERPFRGPLRLQKTFKKKGNRYQLKNRKKKVNAVLLNKKEDKHKDGGIISKAVYGAIKREEYIKNWVARKYSKLDNNSKKRLFSLNTTYQPQTTIAPSQETTPDATTTESQTSLASSTTTSANKNAALPFAPTVLPPKNKFFKVDLDVTVRDGSSSSSVGKASSLLAASSVKDIISEKRKTFLDKLKSSARKSLSDNLFANNVKNGKSSETSSSNISLPTHKSSKKISWVYPRGSDTKVFKKWGGDSISQAEFERKVLGVSTATEVSVKSMICVRGRCYNADDQSLANN